MQTRIFFFLGSFLMAMTLTPSLAEEGLYPTAAEARVAYDWLHKRVDTFLERHPGWAIDFDHPDAGSSRDGILALPKLTPGWATFGLALWQGAAREGLKIGALETQTDVKTRWPDGSIRFAVVTAKIPAKGEYPVRSAARGIGDMGEWLPEGVRVVMKVHGGRTFTATLQDTPSTDQWLSGPLVLESRWALTPATIDGQNHPFLRVLFDVRVYRDREARLDITVENVLDQVGAGLETYDVQVFHGHDELFQQLGVEHWYLTRWRKVFDLGLTQSTIDTDFQPYHRSGALPRFLSSVAKQSYSISGQDFEILGKGANSYKRMSATGGRSELACYPDPAARFIVHGTAGQRQFVLANGDLAGSWPVHIREKDGSLVSITGRPSFWLDRRGKDKPGGNLGETGPLVPDNAHQPSWAYIPYLVTGDRYYADEMAFWANFVLLKTWPDRRGGGRAMAFGVNSGYGDDGGLGLLVPGNQVRGSAWGLRNLVDAAAYLPDDDPMRDYFVEKVENNLEWMDFYHAQLAPLPLGVFPVKASDLDRHGGRMSLWERNFLGWALHHAHEQGFVGGEGFLGALAGFQSKLFTSEPEFPRQYGAPYRLQVADPVGSGRFDFVKSMTDLRARNDGHTSNWNRDYAASARLMLLIVAQSQDDPQ